MTGGSIGEERLRETLNVLASQVQPQPDAYRQARADWLIRCLWKRHVGRKVLRLYGAARRRQGHGPLDFIAQLPDVSGPVVVCKQLQHLRAQLYVPLAETLACLAKKQGAQVRNLFAPMP